MGRNGKTGRTITNQERKARKVNRPQVKAAPHGVWIHADQAAYDQAFSASLKPALLFNHATGKVVHNSVRRTYGPNGVITYHDTPV